MINGRPGFARRDRHRAIRSKSSPPVGGCGLSAAIPGRSYRHFHHYAISEAHLTVKSDANCNTENTCPQIWLLANNLCFCTTSQA